MNKMKAEDQLKTVGNVLSEKEKINQRILSSPERNPTFPRAYLVPHFEMQSRLKSIRKKYNEISEVVHNNFDPEIEFDINELSSRLEKIDVTGESLSQNSFATI